MSTPITPAPRRARRALAVVAATALCATAMPSAATASDTLPWSDESAKGANQPYQHGYSTADLLRWSPDSDLFGDLLRARVPLQDRVDPIAATQQHPELDPSTQLLNLAGDYGNAFFESYQSNNEFSAHVFDYWQYTDYYASWHGMPTAGIPAEWYDPTADWREKWFEFGMLNLPNPAYTNAAHKNGTLSIATIFFSGNDRGHQTYNELLVKDADGRFPVADKLVELANYYGFDGYFVNQESAVSPAQIPDYKRFMQQLRDGGMYVQWYDSVDNATGAISYQNEFNAVNSPWVRDPELGDVSDSIFLNYWWNRSRLTNSKTHAESLGLDPYEVVFAGVEAGMYQFGQPYDLDNNLDANGQPMNSIATLGADFVHSDMADKENDAAQWQAFDRSRQWWTGSSTGRPGGDSSPTWDGISRYIAERSAIDGTTFATTFNTGHGLEYREAGQISNDTEWSNINVQDIPVTWQWDVRTEGAPLDVDYDYGPEYTKAERFTFEQIGAYEGGSSLVLAGTVDADSTVRLFRTALDVTPKSRLAITYNKTSADDDTELRAVVTMTDDPTTEVELPLTGSGMATDGWSTAEIDLAGLAGKQIATISLKVAAGDQTVDDYQVNIGALRLTDGTTLAPATPTGFTLDAALVDTDEAIVSWDLAPYDEVTEYAIYTDGTYLGGIYDETLYIKQLTSEKGTLELYAIGADGQRSAPATISYDLTVAPRDITATSMPDGTVEVTWTEVPAKGPARVQLVSEYSDEVIARSTVIGRGQDDKAVFRDLPIDGGNFRATVQIGKGTPVSFRAEFIDTVVTPYPDGLAAFSTDGRQLALNAPDGVEDWYKLYVKEDGVPQTFTTTYNSGAKPYVIRGRTTSSALSRVRLASGTSEVTVTIEDYAGNQATTTIRQAVTSP